MVFHFAGTTEQSPPRGSILQYISLDYTVKTRWPTDEPALSGGLNGIEVMRVNSEFPKHTEIGSGAYERKRPYPALFSILQAEAKPRLAPKPPWLKARLPGGANYLRFKALTKELCLHTVCKEARCPNIVECPGAGTLTFMILGRVCSRNCGFRAVTFGKPPDYDPGESDRVYW